MTLRAKTLIAQPATLSQARQWGCAAAGEVPAGSPAERRRQLSRRPLRLTARKARG